MYIIVPIVTPSFNQFLGSSTHVQSSSPVLSSMGWSCQVRFIFVDDFTPKMVCKCWFLQHFLDPCIHAEIICPEGFGWFWDTRKSSKLLV